MNAFATALAGVCSARRLEEKRLIAPKLRVGYQWLDTVARSGHPLVNVRVETLHSLAVGLAAPVLAGLGLAVASRRAEELLAERLLRELLPERLRYLGAAAPGPGLAATVLASLTELRVHGVPGTRLRKGVLEDAAKAADLRLLAGEYEQMLGAAGLADYAQVLRTAAERLAAEPDALGPDTLVLVPEDLAPNGLERRLLEAVPAGRLVSLAVDAPGVPGDVRFASAVGEGNEVRSVLRACLERGIALDDVELLHTDRAYTLGLVDALAAIDRPGAPSPADVVTEAPVTFAEGLPCSLSRPGRALAGWRRWMADGYPQAALVAMLREGLLETGERRDEDRVGFSRLAALLRSIPIGRGRGRYLEKIDESIAAVRALIEGAGADHEADGGGEEGRLEESVAQRCERLGGRLAALEVLQGLVSRLLSVCPAEDAGGEALVEAAREFLATCARGAGRFDAFAAERLREELDAMAHWLGRTGGGAAQDVSAWLEALPAEKSVGGSRPRPGCLHVDHVASGGHSGRPHTFVVGLDDARFPGAGLQDPLLLDGERRRLEPAMPTAAGRLEETILGFRRLLGRQRGTVTLSWSSRDLVEDAERFPSQIVVDVYRAARGAPAADQRDVQAEAGAPASFAPDVAGRALDLGEWWLWRFTGDAKVADPGGVLARHAPHVVRGRRAAAGRESAAFTPWDGRVPAAGSDLAPASATGKVLSSNGLETAGACPRKFFYRYALELVPPEELVVEPGRWLDPMTTGSLLHELFERYVRELIREGPPADFARGRALMLAMLEAKLGEYRARYPVPSPAAYAREREQLVGAAEIFVREEERHALQTGAEPVYLEASLGMQPGEHGTDLDHPDPVPVGLPDGRSIRTRGRVDRIDRAGGPGGVWTIWDYKTGGTWGYDRADPFPEGRKIQPYLYLRMVERRLRASVDPLAAVTSFGYLFPGIKGRGERIAWDAGRLAAGAGVLAALCAIIESGAFAATIDDGKDCRWCEYRRACGDVAAQAAASRRKLLSGEPLLAAMALLRAKALGIGSGAEGEGA